LEGGSPTPEEAVKSELNNLEDLDPSAIDNELVLGESKSDPANPVIKDERTYYVEEGGVAIVRVTVIQAVVDDMRHVAGSANCVKAKA
jgi:hypothetical protein